MQKPSSLALSPLALYQRIEDLEARVRILERKAKISGEFSPNSLSEAMTMLGKLRAKGARRDRKGRLMRDH